MKGIPRTVKLCDGGTITLYRYKAVVVGELWNFAQSSYEYIFENELPVGVARGYIKCVAGDFFSVDYYQLWIWGELCEHCHNEGWLLVKDFTPEGLQIYEEICCSAIDEAVIDKGEQAYLETLEEED